MHWVEIARTASGHVADIWEGLGLDAKSAMTGIAGFGLGLAPRMLADGLRERRSAVAQWRSSLGRLEAELTAVERELRYPDLPDPERLSVEHLPPALLDHVRELQSELRRLRTLRARLHTLSDLESGYNSWRTAYERELKYTLELGRVLISYIRFEHQPACGISASKRRVHR